MKNAFCALSDSSIVQEYCIFQVPNVILRDVTERPETIECRSNILARAELDRSARQVAMVTQRAGNWHVPPEYLAENVAETVGCILLGYWYGE